MTQEEYNQLPYDYAHCAGTHCEKASQLLTPHRLHDARNGWTGAVYDGEHECDCRQAALVRSSTLTARNVLHGEYHEYMTMCGWLI